MYLGFVYLFALLHWVTNDGKDLLRAQYIFMFFYLCTTGVVLFIYRRAKLCPPWVSILLCLSRRVHSIFMLRCFNDCTAMLLLYIAIWFFMKNKVIRIVLLPHTVPVIAFLIFFGSIVLPFSLRSGRLAV